MRWMPDHDERLLALAAEGLTNAQIAAAFGYVTEGAVRARLVELHKIAGKKRLWPRVCVICRLRFMSSASNTVCCSVDCDMQRQRDFALRYYYNNCDDPVWHENVKSKARATYHRSNLDPVWRKNNRAYSRKQSRKYAQKHPLRVYLANHTPQQELARLKRKQMLRAAADLLGIPREHLEQHLDLGPEVYHAMKSILKESNP
jgi:hypothetical protein